MSDRPGGSEDETYPLVRVPGAAARPAFDLWIVGAGQTAVRRLPARGVVVLGRSAQCDVSLPDPSISRKHAQLELDERGVRLRDLGSANGVAVRGARVPTDGEVRLAAGDVIELGSVMLVVQRAGPPAPSAPSAAPAGAAAAAGRPAPPRVDVAAPGAIVLDPAMKRVHELAARVAQSAISVLIAGETGVGKEVLAHEVHRASPRRDAPFVRLNCAALAPALLEGELFGYEKGAFTDAHQAKPGLLESADGGTVLLDEVGELPLALQAKLLRVIEDREVLRLGALKPRVVDVRFIAATNRDLGAACARGEFREDLYYRLNGVTLAVPPLRARPDEIAPLAAHFAARAAAAAGSAAPPRFTAAAVERLRRYAWPGNVRELRNAVERAVLLADAGVIDEAQLPPEVLRGARPAAPHGATAASSGSSSSPSLSSNAQPAESAAPEDRRAALERELAQLERQRILDALEKCAGNQTRAAELLGMPRRTLVARLASFGIPRPRKP